MKTVNQTELNSAVAQKENVISLEATIWAQKSTEVQRTKEDETSYSCVLMKPVLKVDAKHGNAKGIRLGNQNFFTGKEYLYLNKNNLSPENIKVAKSVKINKELLELTANFDIEETVSEHDGKETYEYQLNGEPKIIRMQKVCRPNIVSEINSLIKKKRLKELYLLRDEKLKNSHGNSYINTKAELLLTDATALDIGVYLACNMLKNADGNITLNDVASYTQWNINKVKQSFSHLENFGYLKKLKTKKAIQNTYLHPYKFTKSILLDEVTNANAPLADVIIDLGDCDDTEE